MSYEDKLVHCNEAKPIIQQILNGLHGTFNAKEKALRLLDDTLDTNVCPMTHMKIKEWYGLLRDTFKGVIPDNYNDIEKDFKAQLGQYIHTHSRRGGKRRSQRSRRGGKSRRGGRSRRLRR